jgi:hypothetical protein
MGKTVLPLVIGVIVGGAIATVALYARFDGGGAACAALSRIEASRAHGDPLCDVMAFPYDLLANMRRPSPTAPPSKD